MESTLIMVVERTSSCQNQKNAERYRGAKNHQPKALKPHREKPRELEISILNGCDCLYRLGGRDTSFHHHLAAVPNACLPEDNQFLCDDNTTCIIAYWKCDGDADCKDGSDESPRYCSNMQCDAAHFTCNETRRCIPQQWVCDAEPDCGANDTSDEANCGKYALILEKCYCKVLTGWWIPQINVAKVVSSEMNKFILFFAC